MDEDVNKKVVLIVILLSSFISSSNHSMVNVALPVIGRELSMDAIILSWVVTAHLLATASCQVPLGRFADICGRKRLFLIGSIIFMLSTLIIALANVPILLVLARGLGGVGGAMIVTTGLAILTSVFPPAERGQAIAANMAAIYLGIALGPFLGGILTEFLGWRSIFFFSSATSLISVLLVIWKLTGEWAEASGEGFDYRGSIIFVLSISTGMYGFSRLHSLPGVILFSIGLIGTLLFIVLESTIKNPVLDINIFRSNREFSLSVIAVLINYCGVFASSFLLSLYLQYIMGLPPRTAGIVLVTPPAFMTVFAFISAKLGNTFTPRYVATFGLALNCVSLTMLTFLGESSGLWFVIVSLAIFGVGGGLFSSPNINITMSAVENRFLGVASGITTTMRSAGMILSMGITMILFSIFMGNAEVTPEYYPEFLISMRAAYIIFALLCFGGVFVQLGARASRD